MKLGVSHQRPDDLNAARFAYLRTMGVETLEVRLPSTDATFEALKDIRDRVADAGFELHEIMLEDLEDIAAAIREFGASGHIHQVHFRNTSGLLPRFHETFPDNGYVDLVEIMRALVDVGFDGIVVPDHVPGDGPAEEALTFGYIRALIQAFG